MSLKHRTINGVLWSVLENISLHAVQLVIGIILARLLSPADFGLIGMTAIFTAISQSLIDSGLGTALIRKKNCTQDEYSTVFYFNIVLSVLLYVVLYFAAPSIAKFFNTNILVSIIRIVGINIVLLGISLIQKTILIKTIDFKRLTIITLSSNVVSGIIAIVMAYSGFGVWSIVLQILIKSICESILLWGTGKWRPRLVFSIDAFKSLFGFSSKILLSGLLHTIYINATNLVIGKYFTASDLGYYTRARRYSNMVGLNINSVVQRVTFPVLTSISDSKTKLLSSYKKLLSVTSLISCIISLLLVVMSKPIILTLLGEKWSQAIPYLQLLSIESMIYPVSAMNLILLKVKGKSGLYLKMEVYKKILAIPVILTGIIYGIYAMLVAMIVHAIISFFLNSYYTYEMIGYELSKQVRSITQSIVTSMIIALPSLMVLVLLHNDPTKQFFLQIAFALLTATIVIKYSSARNVQELRNVIVFTYRKNIRRLPHLKDSC